ncbi:MAG: L-threonylcarbamoyladenylate synthase [Pirellulales bacterium]|nr:L-threonylcarbamoyladenylate synthase [Pirellulales bacterium]
MTDVFLIHLRLPQPPLIERAAEILRAGGIVAFPTETVYGLGANALDDFACEKIYAIKQRPRHNPLIVHVADIAAVQQITTHWSDTAQELARRFWPGPLTMVLPKGNSVSSVVTGHGPTVAVRIPQHPIALELLRAARLPVAAPSANRSQMLSPTTAEHVLTGLPQGVDMILDGGPTNGGIESTVVDLTCAVPTLLRPGLITPHELRQVVPNLQIAPHLTSDDSLGELTLATELSPASMATTPALLDSGAYAILGGLTPKPTAGTAQLKSGETLPPLPAPGMLARHYAPQARMECWQNGSWRRVQELCRAGQPVGWIKWQDTPLIRHELVRTVELPRNVEVFARRLYAILHNFDEQRLPHVVVELPPEEEIWLAVRDRLRRGAILWSEKRDTKTLAESTAI